MARLEIKTLGAPHIKYDGQLIQINTRKAVALLVYLALTKVSHTRDALAVLFWAESDRPHALGALRYTLSQLKMALGEGWLTVSREQISMNFDQAPGREIVVDAIRVQQLMAELKAHGQEAHQPCAACLAKLVEIVQLYSGALMDGFGLADSPQFDDWLLFEGEKLRQIQVEVLSMLISIHRTQGELSAAISYAQRWLALDPLDEQVNQLLVELYVDNQQKAAARRHHAQFTQLWQTEMGLPPTLDLATIIEQAVAPELAAALTPAPHPIQQRTTAQLAPSTESQTSLPKASRTRLAKLPTPKTPLIGREEELRAIHLLLDESSSRLFTLLGAGGSGKTRLAIAIANERAPRYADGVAFVQLAGLTTPKMVAGTIADALGIANCERGDIQRCLVDFLSEREMLIVLDNIEHLLERNQASDFQLLTLLDEILTEAPQLHLLVTSRTRLNLYEEQLYLVNGLEYPISETLDAAQIEQVKQYGALKLFAQCARRVMPTFALTAETLPGVMKFVRLVAGQPLAIELAAAWMGTLTVDEIVGELMMGEDLLTTTAHNYPERHRSMSATYHFSWKQLQPSEQQLHQDLSVFRGGFSREAAAYIADATPRTLQSLLDQSLLTRFSTSNEQVVYAMHELLRQFAAEQLKRNSPHEDKVHMRHAEYYLEHLAGQVMNTYGKRKQAALLAVEKAIENIRTAWGWCVDRWDNAQVGRHMLRLMTTGISGLCEFYKWRGRVEEGLATCDYVINAIDTGDKNALATTALGHALAWKASFAIVSGNLTLAETLAHRALALLPSEERQMRAFVHYSLGHIAFLGSELSVAIDALEISLSLYEEVGNQTGEAATLGFLARTSWLSGNSQQAHQWYIRALDIHQSHQDQVESARTLADLALVSLYSGDRFNGHHYVQESEAIMATLTDAQEIARVRRQLGMALLYTGHLAKGQEQYEMLVALSMQAGNRNLLVHDKLMLGLAHIIQRNFHQVIEISQEGFQLAQSLGLKRDAGFALMLNGFAELGLGAYQRANDYFESSLQSYQVISLADDQSMTYLGLSLVRRLLGNINGSHQAAIAAMRLGAKRRGVRACVFALIAYANVLIDQGDIEGAVEVEAALTHLRKHHPDPGYFQDLAIHPVAKAAATLSVDRLAAARQRGQKQTVTAMVVELLEVNHTAKILPMSAHEKRSNAKINFPLQRSALSTPDVN